MQRIQNNYAAFACMTDSDLCDQVAGAIEDLLKNSELSDIPRHYSFVYLAYGFNWYVTSKDPDDMLAEYNAESLRTIREAYNLLGLNSTAEFASTLLRISPKFPADQDSNLEEIKSAIETEIGRSFESREQSLYEDADELIPQLSKYIRLNLDRFIELDLTKARDHFLGLNFSPRNPGRLNAIANWAKQFSKDNSGRLPNRHELIVSGTRHGLFGINLDDYNIAEDCEQVQKQRQYIEYLHPIEGYLYGLHNDLTFYRQPIG